MKLVACDKKHPVPAVIPECTTKIEETTSLQRIEFIRPGEVEPFLIVQMNSYSLQALVPAPPVMVKRHRLSGEFKGLKVEEFFENDWDAKSRMSEFGYDVPEGSLKIEQVEVPE